ncbi:type II secretion system F family protein [Citricoccus sp. GCM10030269]|uniref:type II secretion system F family protein n=1 Tax=Citricoccus sp. GCM10030269 TaxID=3273388 RepID=UPI003616ED3F
MNPVMLITGLVLVYAALAVSVWMLGPVRRRPGANRRVRDAEHESPLSRLAARTTRFVESVMSRRKESAVLARRLEDAGLALSPPEFIVLVVVGMVVGFAIGLTAGSMALGILIAVLAPVLAWVLLGVLGSRRRAAFAGQLESSLQLIASSLRAGHSLLRALDAVAQEADSPTREEFSRVINQSRLGRDVNDALRDTAERMQSKDFLWVAQAIAIHREVGGNLAEVLDGVGHTIRERNQVRGLIKSLSAEGRLSGIILMALPVFIVGALMVIQPSYITVLFEDPLGIAMLVAAVVMFGIGGFWMSRVVKIEF